MPNCGHHFFSVSLVVNELRLLFLQPHTGPFFMRAHVLPQCDAYAPKHRNCIAIMLDWCLGRLSYGFQIRDDGFLWPV